MKASDENGWTGITGARPSSPPNSTKSPTFFPGAGILRYLEMHPEISRFVILDDYGFDFREQGLLPYWVQTDFEEENGGLQEKHVKQAARILKLQDHGIFRVQEVLAREKKKKRGWLSRLLTGGGRKE